ncbi:uncharacterized protein [Ambystoma mexicanum]|uniref:uncharacterized protein n=1 Tax=Ambystoma mexicanum TaxID=8296 RepID=UPI0037E70929
MAHGLLSEWMRDRITGLINDLVLEDTALAIVCSKYTDGKKCRIGLTQDGSEPLTRKDECVAAEARRNTVHILKDTLRKKDQLLMNSPEHLVTKAKVHWMWRYTVLTEQRVKNLITVLEKAKFKKNDSEEKQNTYAYVYPKSNDRTIYLCPQFWAAPKHLKKNSQLGTLIHEASHFLGTEDLAYGKETKRIPFGCGGTVVRVILKGLVEVTANADNIEYEFEVTLKHKGNYIRVITATSSYHEYNCCLERAEHSVCIKAVNEDFFKYYKVKKGHAEDIKRDVAELLKAVDTLQQWQGALQEEADIRPARETSCALELLRERSRRQELFRERSQRLEQLRESSRALELVREQLRERSRELELLRERSRELERLGELSLKPMSLGAAEKRAGEAAASEELPVVYENSSDESEDEEAGLPSPAPSAGGAGTHEPFYMGLQPTPFTLDVIVRECLQCLINIRDYTERLRTTLEEFHDFQWAGADTFASPLTSLVVELESCFISLRESSRTSEYVFGLILGRCRVQVNSVVKEVKSLQAAVLATEGLDMFDPE